MNGHHGLFPYFPLRWEK